VLEIRPARSPRAMRALSLAILMLAANAIPALAAGKPGYPDKISWSSLTWDIKTSRSAVGPGPNRFSAANVFVDAGAVRFEGLPT
jgi:hypothetical protein